MIAYQYTVIPLLTMQYKLYTIRFRSPVLSELSLMSLMISTNWIGNIPVRLFNFPSNHSSFNLLTMSIISPSRKDNSLSS